MSASRDSSSTFFRSGTMRFRRSWVMILIALTAGFELCRPATSGTVTNQLLAETRFATECYVVTAPASGPTVMIVGGVHGNEPAGAHAAELIRHWPLTAGKMIVVPRANVPALAANKRNTPGLATNLSNLNRNYPRAGTTEPPRGVQATEIWALVLKHQPAWLLDLHEGYDFNALNPKSVGSSVIATADAQAQAAASRMLAAVNQTITNADLKFVLRGPPIDASLARAAGEFLQIPGFTIETTTKQPLPKRVHQQQLMVHRLLQDLGMVSSEPPGAITAQALPTLVVAASSEPAQFRIAIYKGPGTGGKPPTVVDRLHRPPESSVSSITAEEIQHGALTNFHVVLFGGGSGSKQAEALEASGRAAVRDFVAAGGGYIGICAGAYLATSGYPWSLKLVNARTISPKWRRGVGNIKLELTAPGNDILGAYPGLVECRYANGPIVVRDTHPDLPAFETLAFYRTELAENETPVGVMVDSPAIFATEFKQGRVVCVSPHPEKTAGLEAIVPQAIHWVARRAKAPEKLNARAE